eukprot:Opistho-2@50994
MSDIRKVAVLGTGVLGSQIAFQTAYSGFDVVAYDISEEALEQARARLAALVETYTNEVSGTAGGKAAGALKRIALLSDLGAAVADADLVIEAVPEVLSIKQALYEKLAGLAPDRTIFATNSSTLLPSDLKAFTGRPDRFPGAALRQQHLEVQHCRGDGYGRHRSGRVRCPDRLRLRHRHGADPCSQGESGLRPQFAFGAAPERGRRSGGRRLCRAGRCRQGLADRHRRADGAVPDLRHHRIEHPLQHPVAR